VPEAINHCWSMDSIHGQLTDGRGFRLFKRLDEALARNFDLSLPTERVVRAEGRIIEWRGNPMAIRSDNGPERIVRMPLLWAERHGIRPEHLQPGNPQQNACVGR
jgi:putative transposase